MGQVAGERAGGLPAAARWMAATATMAIARERPADARGGGARAIGGGAEDPGCRRLAGLFRPRASLGGGGRCPHLAVGGDRRDRPDAWAAGGPARLAAVGPAPDPRLNAGRHRADGDAAGRFHGRPGLCGVRAAGHDGSQPVRRDSAAAEEVGRPDRRDSAAPLADAGVRLRPGGHRNRAGGVRAGRNIGRADCFLAQGVERAGLPGAGAGAGPGAAVGKRAAGAGAPALVREPVHACSR